MSRYTNVDEFRFRYNVLRHDESRSAAMRAFCLLAKVASSPLN
jgi:hypothetical protein